MPGAVSGWVALSQRFGALPFADLFEPAIGYAARRLSGLADHRRAWALRRRRARRTSRASPTPSCRAAARRSPARPSPASRPGGDAGGDRRDRRRGVLSRRRSPRAMVAHARAHGGAAHAATTSPRTPSTGSTPLGARLRGARVHEIPPNGQGIAALMALGILAHFDLAALAPDRRRDAAPADRGDEARLRRRAPLRRRSRATGRRRRRRCSTPAYLAARARRIDPARARTSARATPPNGRHRLPRRRPTRAGMMVSLIQSNYMGFGSGVVVPGTGISLQNRGAGFTLEPGHPNEVGPRQASVPHHHPGLPDRDGAPLMAFGVMGGPMQPQGHVQMLVRMVDLRQNPQAALDAPRWKVNSGLSIDLEPTAPAELRTGLAALGHQLKSVEDSLHGLRRRAVHRPGRGWLRRGVRPAPRRPGRRFLRWRSATPTGAAETPRPRRAIGAPAPPGARWRSRRL